MMRSRVLAFWMALAGIGIGIGACGGNVIVETTTGGEGGTTGTGTPTGAGGDDVQAICTKFCAVGDAFGCETGGATCPQTCVGGVATIPQACQDEYLDLLDCASVEIPQSGCDLLGVCEAEILAFGNCVGGTVPGCDGAECAGSETSCACKGVCDGQTRAVECAAQGTQFACTCFVDGSSVGTCSEPVGQNTFCDLEFGCCSAFF